MVWLRVYRNNNTVRMASALGVPDSAQQKWRGACRGEAQMAQETTGQDQVQGQAAAMVPEYKPAPQPVIREITMEDVQAAFYEGLNDFRAAPAYGLFFGAVYAAGGILMLALVIALDAVYLAYPLAAGFALIGPFVAVGLYEVSRRRDQGEKRGLGADSLGGDFLRRSKAQSAISAGWASSRCFVPDHLASKSGATAAWRCSSASSPFAPHLRRHSLNVGLTTPEGNCSLPARRPQCTIGALLGTPAPCSR